MRSAKYLLAAALIALISPSALANDDAEITVTESADREQSALVESVEQKQGSVELVEVAEEASYEEIRTGPLPCTCGIFLSGQFKKGSKAPPKGVPVLTQEMDAYYAHNAIGNRQCANKCLELIIKHLPKSADIICATLDRDCHKEKAYLFTQNYDDVWVNTNMSAGREFCCKDNAVVKCPK